MKRTLIAAALLAASGSTLAAEIVLFAGENFRGPRIQVESPVPNLARSGFNELASSISVRRGTWQACDDSAFRGNCVTLPEGDYPNGGVNPYNPTAASMKTRTYRTEIVKNHSG